MRAAGTCFLLLLALGSAAVLGWWNVSRFIDAKPKPRLKDKLQFLPHPNVAKALSFGQAGTLSKLRMIDSFSFFAFQIEVRDDSVAGDGRGAFKRLYETLIAMDPHFLPFYQKAATAIGGVLEDHHGELEIMSAALGRFPDNREVWMHFLAVLEANFNFEARQPEILDAMLADWEAMEQRIPEGKPHMPARWREYMKKRQALGQAQLALFAQQLMQAEADAPYGPTALLLQRKIRSLLATKQQQKLQALLNACKERTGAVPKRLLDLAVKEDLLQVYHPFHLAFHPAQPWHVTDMKVWDVSLRRDPFGYNWFLQDDKVISIGHQRLLFEQELNRWNQKYAEAAKREGRWAKDLPEAMRWAEMTDGDIPPTLRIFLDDGQMLLEQPLMVVKPWTYLELMAAAGLSR